MFARYSLILVCLVLSHYPIKVSARLCYQCSNFTPTFNYDNKDLSGTKVPSCFFHTNITCIAPASKCFVEVRKSGDKFFVKKGCVEDSVATNCKASGNTERCVCSTRLCNSDIHNLGGKHYEKLYKIEKFDENSCRMKMPSSMALICGLLTVLVFFHCMTYASALKCCEGTTELRKTDTGTGRSKPCSKHGISCEDVGCALHRCDQDTDMCPKTVTCGVDDNNVNSSSIVTNMTTPAPSQRKYFCRLLYYDLVKTKDDSTGVNIEGQHWAMQECYDTSPEFGEGKEEIGCEFYSKPFYLDPDTRMTHLKDCYCSEDMCNANIMEICRSVTPSIASTNETCKSYGTRRIEKVNLTYILLAIVLKLIFL